MSHPSGPANKVSTLVSAKDTATDAAQGNVAGAGLTAASPPEDVLETLTAIHGKLLDLERECEGHLRDVAPPYAESARNLVHYLALRRHDIRDLQEQLAARGLSSLGRTESHVRAGVEAVLTALQHLVHRATPPEARLVAALDFVQGAALLRAHTEALLGARPGPRRVRIMVTMPSEAARDYQLVHALLANGMDCMRINCAHDDPSAWVQMAENLRRARQELGRECRILMDLAGPKLRTGTIDVRTQVLKWRPLRDLHGRVTSPAHVWLTRAECPEEPPVAVDGALRIPGAILAQMRRGDVLKFTDLRGKSRTLEVGNSLGGGRWTTTTETAYLRAEGVVPMALCPRGPRTKRREAAFGAVVELPSAADLFLLVKPGDVLILTRSPEPGRPAVFDDQGNVREPATIACTLPEVFDGVRPRERIWFDDGKIGGIIESVTPDALRIRITSGKATGVKLRADKGINLPDSDVRLPALTAKDIADLDFVVRHAELVGLSFVRQPADVRALQAELRQRNAEHLGVILKIETRTGFEHLPGLLLAAMRGPRVGVMIARGDLAVECGWERLAEVQEEILWVCEAAHVPVIWATQVLENLAKKGVPSRAEITDAAMGERAECVMLNKGPHLIDAVRTLDDILRRMEAHQTKKTARLRPLRLSESLVP